MDIFTRQKFVKWILLILVLVNLVSIGTLWYMHFSKGQLPPPPHPGAKPDLVQRSMMQFLVKEIELNEEQAQQFYEIQDTFFKETRVFVDENERLRREITDAAFMLHPDRNKFEQLSARIGANQMQLERHRVHFFADLIAACTDDQKEHLIELLRYTLERSRPTHGAPPPPGHFPE